MGMFKKHQSKSSKSPIEADSEGLQSEQQQQQQQQQHQHQQQDEASSSPISVVEPAMFLPREKQQHNHTDLHKGYKPNSAPNSPNKKSSSKQVAPYPKAVSNNPKIYPKSPVKSSPSHSPLTIVHNSRDNRPSTATQKEQRHLQDKAHIKPPLNGTTSTSLWLAQAAHDDIHYSPIDSNINDRDLLGNTSRSTHSAVSYYEEILEGGFDEDPQDSHPYESNFFEYIEDTPEPQQQQQHLPPTAAMLVDPVFSQMPNRKITIRFDEYDEMQTCLHINDYTKHEISRSWYKREDYDRMVELARKTAAKAVKREKELRDELESVLGNTKNNRNKNNNNNDGNDQHEENPEDDDDDDDENAGDKSNSKSNTKKKKPIEYRGLEAWTPDGAAKVRLLKETAIELVWNEQSRQWEDGTFDAYAISSVYMPVALTATLAARERAIGDETIVQKLKEQEELRAIKKKNRNVYKKSKAVLKKTAKNTGLGLVHGTNKIVSTTGKVGKKLGKRGVKAGVATATLDPRMMKEALKFRVTGNKKRECAREKIVTTSRAAHERDAEEEQQQQQQQQFAILHSSSNLSNSQSSSIHYEDPLSKTNSTGLFDSMSIGDLSSTMDSAHVQIPDELCSIHSNTSKKSSDSNNNKNSSKKNKKNKKKKLKLLGVVPIPGTKKVYKEERRERRAEKRIQKMSRRPSWEAGISTGKY